MRAPIRTVAFAAAVLGIAVAGCSLLSSAPSATPVPTLGVSDARIIREGQKLEPGITYALRSFDPPFTFSGSAHVILTQDGASSVRFDVTPYPGGAIAVVRAQAVFDETGTVAAVPVDLAAWLQARTDLMIVSTRQVELGSVSGTLIDATVKPDAHANGDGLIRIACGDPLASCDFRSGEPPAYVRGAHAFILVATVGGQPVVAVGSTNPTRWASIGPEIDAFFRSIRFPG